MDVVLCLHSTLGDAFLVLNLEHVRCKWGNLTIGQGSLSSTNI